MHVTIKFLMETSKVEISFLDTMVKLENRKIVTNLYCKPTDETEPKKTSQDLTCIAHSCRYCPKLNTTGKITSKVTGQKYHSRTKATCNSNNIVYCISCRTCGKQYVGQTKNTVKKRFQAHFYQIAHEPQKT